MRFSVVLPTFKRPEILKRCLEALQAQDFNKDNFEVVVIEDGGSDNSKTSEITRSFGKTLPVRYFSKSHEGQGVARNLGIKEARGEIIIFIGDDIFPDRNFLKEHDEAHFIHRGDNEAVLGFVEWHPELTVTPLMQFMTTGGAIFGKFGGHQFAYDLLESKEEANFRFFYTANISLKRKLLLDHPFDPWFSGYGWEDIELGYRLQKHANLRIFYHPKAIGYHYHPMTEADFASRMRNIGQSSLLFHEKYPELQKIPSFQKRLAFRLISNSLSLALFRKFHPFWYYYALSKKYYLEGIAHEVSNFKNKN